MITCTHRALKSSLVVLLKLDVIGNWPHDKLLKLYFLFATIILDSTRQCKCSGQVRLFHWRFLSWSLLPSVLREIGVFFWDKALRISVSLFCMPLKHQMLPKIKLSQNLDLCNLVKRLFWLICLSPVRHQGRKSFCLSQLRRKPAFLAPLGLFQSLAESNVCSFTVVFGNSMVDKCCSWCLWHIHPVSWSTIRINFPY